MNVEYKKIKKTVLESFNSIKDFKNKKYLVAISGGADSVFLSYFFRDLKLDFGLVHVNYKLRGKASDGDETLCKNLAKNFDCNFYLKKTNKAELKNMKMSIQMAAREIRYTFFNEIKEKNKYDYIVLAHHANDQAETMLLNLFRGCGIQGIKGMVTLENTLFRPLLHIEKSTIYKIVKANAWAFRHDSSNDKNYYSRNYLRNEIIPKIEKNWPGFLKVMNQNASLFQQEALAIKHQNFNFDFTNNFKISNKKLQNPLYLNAFMFEIHQLGFDVKIVKQLLQSNTNGETKKVIAANGTIEIKNQVISFYKNLTFNPYFELKKSKIAIYDLKTDELAKFIEVIDGSKLKGKLFLRKWQAGDKMMPLGMKNLKKISDVLTDLKCTLKQKAETFVLCDEQKIVWLIGFRIDERVKLDNKTINKDKIKMKIKK